VGVTYALAHNKNAIEAKIQRSYCIISKVFLLSERLVSEKAFARKTSATFFFVFTQKNISEI